VDRAQQTALGFDIRELVVGALTALGAPRRWIRRADALLQGRDTGRGLLSVAALFEDDEVKQETTALMERFRRDWRAKLWLVRTLRRAPQTDEARAAVAERLYELVGFDMPGLRQAVAELPREDMAWCFGPVTDLTELFGYIFREPWMLYVQLCHGRRCSEVRGRSAKDLIDKVLGVLLDPEVRVVCTQGHGTWSTLSLYGVYVDPDDTFAELCREARTSPADLLRRSTGRLHELLRTYPQHGSLKEGRLAVAADQMLPDPEARAMATKDLIVRYTCGSVRYEADLGMVRGLIPPEVVERLDLSSKGFAPRQPGTTDWSGPLRAWLADKAIEVRPAAGWGESFVARPEDTRGFDGLAWIQHFLADPIPEHREPEPFIVRIEGGESRR